MTRQEFIEKYPAQALRYKKLAKKIQSTIKRALKDADINYDSVPFRVKELDSAYDKYIFKNFESPYEQIEDWCGLRIICYYLSDIDRISTILEDNFNIIKKEDKALTLDISTFGYRSVHFIIKLKDSWYEVPEYKYLEGLKAEVQVRTVAMHAWAQLEHKLQYKSAAAAPSEFRRMLYRLSAKFEEADEQFEAIRNGIKSYQASVLERVEKIEDELDTFKNEELNRPHAESMVIIPREVGL